MKQFISGKYNKNGLSPQYYIFFHPDCNRRHRNFTDSCVSAYSVGSWAITTGRGFHPALKILYLTKL